MENRRPLTTRSLSWVIWLSKKLASYNVSPNTISTFSVLPALLAAGLLTCPFININLADKLMIVAVLIQLRLICNLLDGMVAIEGGKKSNVGALYNEVPDRIADSLIIVALGYAVGEPWLGWVGALLAAITAYIRVLGGSLGLPQDFKGPMAKQHRMFVLTIACVLAAIETTVLGSTVALLLAAWVIAIGSGITCVTRLKSMSDSLKSK